MVVFLIAEKSHVARPGPFRLFRLRFPKNPLFTGGCRNAAGLNHCAGVPRIGFPVKLGLENGLTGLRVSPSLDGLYLSCGVNGNPLCRVTMLSTDQPLTRPLAKPRIPLANA